MHLVYRKSCRVCGSTALTPVINLGAQHLQGSFVKPGKEMPPTRAIPMSLVRCDPTRDEKACGLLQMEHTVPPEILYSAYWYRSGTNATMRNHLRGIADTAAAMIGKPSATVLDIGCNDGTLLKSYPKGFVKYGIDPSDVAEEIDPADATVVKGIFPSSELSGLVKDRRMDIVTSIAMFYDLEDPAAFTRGIKQILSPDGIWIFEMSYMPTMLKMTSYDTICHEHIEYYSLSVIEHILKLAGLKVFDVEHNNINGGSLRCYATHEDNFLYRKPEYRERLYAMYQDEFDLMLDTDKPYKNFQDKINMHRDELIGLLKSIKKEGKSIHIYGASTKGNTILQWCGIDNRIIDVAAERNPDKYGAHTLGTDIPIVSESESRAMKPDYYLVLPWHFKEEFIERERETVAAGTQLIFPLPTVEVISKDGAGHKRGTWPSA